jgi:peptide/nickel transport system permease protein
MLKYIIKRVLIFIPTLLAISLLTFIISINAPGDPAEMMLSNSNGGNGQSTQKLATEKAYMAVRHQLGLDLPVFYFTLSDASVPDTLYRVPKMMQRKSLERMCNEYGNWEYISPFFLQGLKFELALFNIKKDSSNANALTQIKDNVSSLLQTYQEAKLNFYFSKLDQILSQNPNLLNAENAGMYAAFKGGYEQIIQKKNPYLKYVPAIHFYGFNNQYHKWISKFIVGDFGISYQDKRPVSSVLWDAMRWTMMISLISIIISYLVAIPLGIKSAVKKGSKSDRVITTSLFMMYSLPNFWIATMMIIFFCGGDYFDWFPAFGLGTAPPDAPFFERFTDTAYHLILPVICWTYGTFAFLSRQMRGGVLNVIGQDYIRTARAKGLPESKVIWKHAFNNSLLPIITLFANIFPLIISGSFAIEFIFSIPGMGKITIEALNARNYPVVFTVMLFSAFLTLIGTLVADIIYATVDPRISFSKKA